MVSVVAKGSGECTMKFDSGVQVLAGFLASQIVPKMGEGSSGATPQFEVFPVGYLGLDSAQTFEDLYKHDIKSLGCSLIETVGDLDDLLIHCDEFIPFNNQAYLAMRPVKDPEGKKRVLLVVNSFKGLRIRAMEADSVLKHMSGKELIVFRRN